MTDHQQPKSSWFQRGQQARKQRIPLRKTIVVQLRVGSDAYEEFLSGYDHPND